MLLAVKGFSNLHTGNGSVSKYGHHHRCREQFRVLIAYTHTQCGLECVGLGVCFGTDWDGMLSLVEGEGLAGRN
jgi:hypothetical protein